MKTILIYIIIRLFKGKYYSISGNAETLMKVAEIAEKCGYKLHIHYNIGDSHVILYKKMFYGYYNHRGANIQFTIKL